MRRHSPHYGLYGELTAEHGKSSPIRAKFGGISVELMKWLHEERKYPSLEALQAGIAADVVDAKAYFGL